jgi:hypothetical protein
MYLDSYFIGGFKYDGKAVFGVIETSERIETVISFFFYLLLNKYLIILRIVYHD